jgi:hypothetical protein
MVEARGEIENADECWPWAIIAAAMMATLDHVQWATASPRPGLGGMWCDLVQRATGTGTLGEGADGAGESGAG